MWTHGSDGEERQRNLRQKPSCGDAVTGWYMMRSATNNGSCGWMIAILAVLVQTACITNTSPDLTAAEALKLTREAQAIQDLAKTCVADGGRELVMRCNIFKVEATERFPDSEGQFCYRAKVQWAWSLVAGGTCEAMKAVHTATAEFRFHGERWHFFSLYGEGIEGEIYANRAR